MRVSRTVVAWLFLPLKSIPSLARLQVRRDPPSWSEQMIPTLTSPGKPSRVVVLDTGSTKAILL
ncbi:hypothetical protein E2C01_028696 [Portunus trituberculatus]|uniref:Uncharacterized protein n=1 Tax=Portunus trituberculatus TaxID=210409 RepID=A0A5B7EPX1_PORTR|nr:hypothetical protein [Portunus trituberculatus]